jgi:hypothetical protein
MQISTDADVLVKEARGIRNARHLSGSLPLKDGRHARFDVLYEPTTGFYWQFEQYSADAASGVQFDGEWEKSFWVFPEIGIIRVVPGPTGVRFEVSRNTATNAQAAIERISTGLRQREAEGKASERPPYVFVRLTKSLGDDFFFRPGDASPQPLAKVGSLDYTNGTFRLELESGLTHRKATVVLDKDFKVVGGTGR